MTYFNLVFALRSAKKDGKISESKFTKRAEFDGVFKYVFGIFFVNWTLNLHILIEDDDDDGDNVQISGPVVFEQYVVTADYQKKNKNDISLTAGDLVDVIERNDYGKIFICGKPRGFNRSYFEVLINLIDLIENDHSLQ